MDKIKAEPFDLLQYLYSAAHEPLIHGFIRFSGHLDEQRLKRAVTISLGAIPVIGFVFDPSLKHPCWRKRDFTGEDIVQTVLLPTGDAAAEDDEEEKRYLASSIDIEREPQLKLFLLRKPDSDILCAVINHMVCDGAGFKDYLYLLSGIYTKLSCGGDASIPCCHSRSIRQLFKSIGFAEKAGILFSGYGMPKPKPKQAVTSFDGDETNPFFVTRSLSKEDFSLLRGFSKSRGATVNDVILAGYARMLSRKTGSERIVIPCPVDLRKYLKEPEKTGICNLTSNYFCDVTVCPQDSFGDTLSQVSPQMKRQKDNKNCLKAMMLLQSIFTALPFRFIQSNFSKLFTIPVTSFTNLGIVDKERFSFGDTAIQELFLTGAVKHTPYFQIAVSTFDSVCTLSCNLYGTPRDQQLIGEYLEEMAADIITAAKGSETRQMIEESSAVKD